MSQLGTREDQVTHCDKHLDFTLHTMELGDFEALVTRFSDIALVADVKRSFKYVYYFPHNNPVR